jgi:hypothetical protein
MSTDLDTTNPPAQTPTNAVPVYNVPPPGTPTEEKVDKIVVYGHSNILYWWPVWAACFVLAAWTYMDNYQMAAVPPGSQAVTQAEVEGFGEPRDAIVAPPGKHFPLAPGTGKPLQADMTVAGGNGPGVIFVMTLLLVAIVSTLTLRGLLSVIALITIFALVLAFALLGWWDDIFRFFGGLDIRLNAAGYLFLGIPLLLIWAIVVFVLDRQHYAVFDEGQIQYVLDIGDGVRVADVAGAVVEKRRSDVFRHWLLGFGTGDLHVRTGGQNGVIIDLENVFNINRKLRVINNKLQQKAMVSE